MNNLFFEIWIPDRVEDIYIKINELNMSMDELLNLFEIRGHFQMSLHLKKDDFIAYINAVVDDFIDNGIYL